MKVKGFFLRALLTVALFVPLIAQAQVDPARISEYTYEVTQRVAYQSIAPASIGGTAFTSTALSTGAAKVALPFDMYFGGTLLTQGTNIVVKPNGTLTFEGTQAEVAPLARFSGDNFGGITNSSVYYLSSVSEVIVEWKDITWGPVVYNFQVKLYPNGNIKFHYGQISNFNGTRDHHVGLKDVVAGSAQYYSIAEGTLCGSLSWEPTCQDLPADTTGWAHHPVSSSNHPYYNAGRSTMYTLHRKVCYHTMYDTCVSTPSFYEWIVDHDGTDADQLHMFYYLHGKAPFPGNIDHSDTIDTWGEETPAHNLLRPYTGARYLDTIISWESPEYREQCVDEPVIYLHVAFATTGTSDTVLCDNSSSAYFASLEQAGFVAHDTINGKVWVKTGLVNAEGADSTSVIYVKLSQNSNITFPAVTACDKYVWNVTTLDGETVSRTITGAYNDTVCMIIPNAAGCDSIITMNLTINERVLVDVDTAACVSMVHPWQGNTLTQSCDIFGTLQTSKGCDSIIRMHVTINPVVYATVEDSICTQLWLNGRLYNKGFVDETVTTPSVLTGCDSITTLRHHIIERVFTDIYVYSNDAYTWTVGGYDRNDAGELVAIEPYTVGTYTQDVDEEYFNVLAIGTGCDSTLVLHYDRMNVPTTFCENELPVYVAYTTASGDTAYTFEILPGTEDATPGRHTQERHMAHVPTNYDSVAIFSYTINPSYTMPETLVVCENQIPTTYGKNDWNNGVDLNTLNPQVGVNNFQIALKTKQGCDSIINLKLTVNPVYDMLVEKEACQDHPFSIVLGEETFTVTPTAVQANTTLTFNANTNEMFALQTAAGCDSLITLNLFVNPTTTSTQNVVACNEYTWSLLPTSSWTNPDTNTVKQFTENVTIVNAKGCDSVVTLNLTLNGPIYTMDTIIAHEGSYRWPEQTGRIYYHQSPTVWDSFHIFASVGTSVAGCDSNVHMVLFVGNDVVRDTNVDACGEYTWLSEVGGDNTTFYFADAIYRNPLSDTAYWFVADSAHIYGDGCNTPGFNNSVHDIAGKAIGDTVYVMRSEHPVVRHCRVIDNMFDSLYRMQLTIAQAVYAYDTIARFPVSLNTLEMPLFQMEDTTGALVTVPFVWDLSEYNTPDSVPAWASTGLWIDTTMALKALGYEPWGYCDSIVKLSVHLDYDYYRFFDTICHTDLQFNENVTINPAVAFVPMPDGVSVVNSINETYPTSHINIDIDTEFLWIDTLNAGTFNEAIVSQYVKQVRKKYGTEYVTSCQRIFTWMHYNNVTGDMDSVGTYATSTSYPTHAIKDWRIESSDPAVRAQACDSVVTLTLNMLEAFWTIDTIEACVPFTWDRNGVTYGVKPGDYANGTLVENMDTIYVAMDEYNASEVNDYDENYCNGTYHILTLKVKNPTVATPETYDYAAACDSYKWHGTTYTATGIYNFDTTNAVGCDSVATLSLVVAPTVVVDTTVHNQNMFGYSYTWMPYGKDSQTWTTPGMYHDTLQFAVTNGNARVLCDSIFNIQLNPSIIVDTIVTICDDYLHTATYTWDRTGTTWGADIRHQIPMVRKDTVMIGGVDSDTLMLLSVRKGMTHYYVERFEPVCDSMIWTVNYTTGHWTLVDGEFEYVIDSENSVNVDTVYRTVSYHNAETYVSFDWISPNTGCDTVQYLDVVVNHRDTANFIETVCANQLPFAWMDGADTAMMIPAAGTYEYHRATEAGCDSAMFLTVKVNRVVDTNITDDICLTDDYMVGHKHLTYLDDLPVDGYYYYRDTLTHPTTGCDSIVNLTLWVRPVTHYRVPEVVTCHESFTWTLTEVFNRLHKDVPAGRVSNVVFNESDLAYKSYTTGIIDTNATHVMTNMYGCDSVVSLHLIFGDAQVSTIEHNVCSVMDFVHPQTNELFHITADTVITELFEDPIYCDSIVEHVFYIHQPAEFYGVDAQVACDTYTWLDGNTYTASTNTPTFTLVHGGMYGCDSVITLNLTVNYTVNDPVVNTTVCDSYTWNDITYTTSGVYTQTFTAANGCDSIHTVDLTVNYSNTGIDVQNVCDQFTWIDGNTYTTNNNTATYTLTNAAGCDSVVSLYLTIRHSSAGVDAQIACDNYTWIDGNTYTASTTTPTFTLTNHEGCDSVVTLNLTIKYSVHNSFEVTACDNYTWNEFTYTTSGDKVQTFTAANGCDSIVTCHLTVNNTVYATAPAVEECVSYTWNGITYTTSGVYTQTLVAANGCDSVVTCAITIKQPVYSTFAATSCDSYVWNGITYTVSGNYNQTFTAANGCDSIVTLNLTINPTTYGVDPQVACDSYTWMDGNTYTTSNTYATWTLVNQYGCDSIVTLNLTIKNSVHNSFTAAGCDSYTWNGISYTTSGDKVQTFTAANGCDSVVTLHLTINHPVYTTAAPVVSCVNYTWNGITYTTSGVYTQTFTAANGCDSVVTCNITINQPVTSSVTATACDSYSWNGITYTTSGVYTQTFTAANNCDSVVTLTLNVNYSTTGVDTHVACDSYTWMDGVTYTSSNNNATYTIINHAGCDSVVTLHLTINYSNAGVDNQVACDSYTWNNGHTYTASTVDHYTWTNVAGCDSVVTLNLTINYSAATTEYQNVCDSYTWNGNTYTTSGVYTALLQTVNGCDSLATLNLTVRYSTTGDTTAYAGSNTGFNWYGQSFTTVGEHTATHTLTNAVGCDSVLTLHLTIINSDPASLQIIAYNDKVVMVNHYPQTIKGDQDFKNFTNYQWYRGDYHMAPGEAIKDANLDYFMEADMSNLRGSFYVIATPTDENGNVTGAPLASNVITFASNGNQGIDDVEATEITLTVAPNPVTAGNMIKVSTNLSDEMLQGARLMMYDVNGRVVLSQNMEQNTVSFSADYAAGVYAVRVITKSGDSYVRKVVIR